MKKQNGNLWGVVARSGWLWGFVAAIGIFGGCASDQQQLDDKLNAPADNQANNADLGISKDSKGNAVSPGKSKKGGGGDQGASLNNAQTDNFGAGNQALGNGAAKANGSDAPADGSPQSQKGADINSAAVSGDAAQGADQKDMYSNNTGTSEGQDLLDNVPQDKMTPASDAEGNVAQYNGAAGGTVQQTKGQANAGGQPDQTGDTQNGKPQGQTGQQAQGKQGAADNSQRPPAGWAKTSDGQYLKASDLTNKPVGRSKKIKRWR